MAPRVSRCAGHGRSQVRGKSARDSLPAFGARPETASCASARACYALRMALFLCAACDRHLRPDAPSCPFCGASAHAEVPPETRSHRTAIVLGVASVVLAVESVACSAVYGAPGVWVDPPPPPGPDASIDAAFTPPPPTPPTCYSPGDVEPIVGVPPALSQGVCTPAALVALADACLDGAGSCPATIAADRVCAACALGPYAGRSGPSAPIGAIVPAGGDAVAAATYACAALVIGRPECAVPAQRAVTCVTTACATCAPSELSTCAPKAEASVCSSAFVVARSCLEAIDTRRGEWLGRCTGRTTRDGFLAVARELCGASPLDAGADAPADAPSDAARDR